MGTVHVVDIVRHGKQFVIPEGMSYDNAIASLERRKDYEEQEIELRETIKTFVWDGALALQKAISEMFGWSNAETIEIQGFFSKQKIKPAMIQIETGVNETTLVPWGRFTLPNVSGYIETRVAKKNGQPAFEIFASIKRKDEATITELVKKTKEIVEKQSIYKGKAIKMRFYDESGSALKFPEPSFLDTEKVKREEIIFSEDLEKSIKGNLFTPIQHREHCEKYKIPLKRGVLLSGTYGTGKTLVAYATAKECVDNGWTFIMTERADELARMVEFAKQYQPSVVFCEDIDRVVNGERTVDIDNILNIIDGIESKHTDIMVVLTTNHVEKINKAMLRPGRLDAVINVLPPNADAVERLIKL